MVSLLFLSKPKDWYVIVVGVYHHAPACISFGLITYRNKLRITYKACALIKCAISAILYARCEKILEKHQTQMEEVAIDSLKSEKAVSGDYLDYYYSCYREEGYVTFDIDAQGMLGGQYWKLVYTEDGILYGKSESYLYEEFGGNDIIKAERLNDHWWFLWTDYDGTDRSYK